MFWSEIGSGFEEPAHPHHEFRGVPPLGQLIWMEREVGGAPWETVHKSFKK